MSPLFLQLVVALDTTGSCNQCSEVVVPLANLVDLVNFDSAI